MNDWAEDMIYFKSNLFPYCFLKNVSPNQFCKLEREYCQHFLLLL